MKFTASQTEAIYKRGCNILVSAGAGSGKTAVLAERILEFVKAGNSVKDLLVLTFTRAAALEMKQRIYNKLIENKLYEEANLTLSSNITNFDSYSLQIVKQYYYYLNVDPNLGIVDENVINSEMKKILTELFSNYYDIEKLDFLNYIKRQKLKDDTRIIDLIISLVKKLDLLYDPISYLDSYSANYFNDNFLDKVVNDYEKVMFIKANEIMNDLITLDDMIDSVKVKEDIAKVIDKLHKANNYMELKAVVDNYKISVLRGASEEATVLKDSIAKKVKALKGLMVFADYEAIKTNVLSEREGINFIIETVKILYSEIDKFKKMYSCYSFNDIAKMAIKLVREFPAVKEELSKYKEILVDEYQDTSDLQEAFLLEIAHDNLYMVGDLKQSIYQFRNANPYIFKTKYEDYKLGKNGYKIDLVENFRSRSQVLDTINLFFDNLMTPALGDVDYISDGRMQYGFLAYDKCDHDYYQTEVLRYETLEDKSFNNQEIEVFIAANKVKEIIDNCVVYDKKAEVFRKARYSDIAIIIDRGATFPLFKKIFEYLGIPLSIEADSDITNNNMTYLLISLLKLVANIKNKNYDNDFKHALVSVLRSFVYEYSDEEIYHIIKNENYDLDVIHQIESINLYEASYNIYYELLDKLDIYHKLPKIGKVNPSLTIIEYIGSLLVNYNKAGYNFDKTVELLEDIMSGGADIKLNFTSNTNNEVKIMTIHHSKGLEYPFCIFPMLSPNLNEDDKKSLASYSKEYGIYLSKDEEEQNGVLYLLNNELTTARDLSERVRVIYVALTRAREKVIIILNKEQAKTLKSFNGMLYKTNSIDRYSKDVDIDSLNLTKEYEYQKLEKDLPFGKNILEYHIPNYKSARLTKGAISKTTNDILSNSVKEVLKLGTNIHDTLASLDLVDPDYSLIDSRYVDMIKKLLDREIFKDIAKAKIYQEKEFYFEYDNNSYYGIMDLLLEYDDHFVIIDYKLSDLSKEEYIRQLGVYKKYLNTISDKRVEVYLVSILRTEVKDITNEV